MSTRLIASLMLISLPALAEPHETPLSLERELTVLERRTLAAPLIAACDAVIAKAARTGHPNCRIANREPVNFDRSNPETLLGPSGILGVAGAAPWAWDAFVDCGGIHVEVSLHATPLLRSRAWQHPVAQSDTVESRQEVISNTVTGDEPDYEFSSAALDKRRLFERAQIGALIGNQDEARNPSAAGRVPALAKPVAIVISLLASGEILQNFVDIDAVREVLARAEPVPQLPRVDESSDRHLSSDGRRAAEWSVYSSLLPGGKTSLVRLLTDPRRLPENVLTMAPRLAPDIRTSELLDYVRVNRTSSTLSSGFNRNGAPVELFSEAANPDRTRSGEFVAFSRVGFSSDLSEAVVYELTQAGPEDRKGTLYFLVATRSGWTTRYTQTLEETDCE